MSIEGMNAADDPLTVHDRHVPVERARRELAGFLYDWSERNGLSDAEYLHLLVAALSDRVASHLRTERDPS